MNLKISPLIGMRRTVSIDEIWRRKPSMKYLKDALSHYIIASDLEMRNLMKNEQLTRRGLFNMLVQG
jgi:hypothetical protein